MKLQLLSDLHLESEDFAESPAPGAELLVLAGDICSRWEGLDRFAGWPVPVLFVAGNHEFDGRDIDEAATALRQRCAALGLQLLERESLILADAQGQRIRFLGTTRWTDFDAFGAARRPQALRAGSYFQRVMKATRHGRDFDAEAVRTEALACRAWLEAELQRSAGPSPGTPGGWDKTVVITHFAPSLRSADPRYGKQPGTASFCNADDDLLPRADLWLHGHLHCRHDYLQPRAGLRPTRVVCQARGLAAKGEDLGYDGQRLIEI